MTTAQLLRRMARHVLALAAATLASAAIAAPPAAPTVIGPLPVNATPGVGVTRDYPFFATEPQFDLTGAGYREEEFFIQGMATAYNTPSMADGTVISTGNPYKTRILVKRPANPRQFNGVVLVEWDNVTSGYGIPLHWQYSSEYLTRAGYVHVSVQAQRVGVQQPTTGLKDWSPTRYGSLDVTAGGTITNDSVSYDIFSQVAVALRGAAKSQILPELEPKVFIAVGQSQSAGRLTSYYNSIQPLHKVYDGFVLQVLGGPFRTDVDAKMIRVISEQELQNFGLGATRQPDSPTLREWEIAGAAHVDYWWIQTRQAYAVRDKETPPNLACAPEPGSHVPLRFVLNASYDHMVKWITKGTPPPSAEPIVMTSINPPVIARDANGLAYGGIRQHEVEAPTAMNRGDQPGITPGCSNLYGQHVPFSDAKIDSLYPTHATYVRAVTSAVQKNVQQGFVLKEDGEQIIRRALVSPVGTGRPIPIH